MDRFNRVFQKSTETPYLSSILSRLVHVRVFASNLFSKEAILAATDDLHHLNLDSDNQLSDENLGIGSYTWSCLYQFKEHYLKPFFVQ